MGMLGWILEHKPTQHDHAEPQCALLLPRPNDTGRDVVNPARDHRGTRVHGSLALATFLLELLMFNSGCVELRTTACGDLVCAANRVCSERHRQCVLSEQMDACAHLSDGESCTYPGVSDGRCLSSVCFAVACGNGNVEPGEVCDDGNTFDGDGCNAVCRSDETCGNGTIDEEVGERCDDGNIRDGDGCQADCSLPRCGDGIVDADEVCDDGNRVAGDGCSPRCTSNETCGNGIIDVEVGERCDDGNLIDGDGCQMGCALPRCGDGVLDPEELCDDGNDRAGDGCNPRCTSDETCGNGVIDVSIGEECDDGNIEVGDGCGTTCHIETCGNGIVDPGELCDDANDVRGDGCATDCRSDETCGNGVIDVFVGEECDDDNLAAGDGCGPTCRIEACGNGVVDPLEVCDDGNLLSGDGCSATCLSLEVCGNGITDPGSGEACDDGDRQSHDGCSSSCTVEFPVWSELILGEYTPRIGAAAVYDPIRQKVVMFGGQLHAGPAGADLNDTWEFDGNSWRQRTTDNAPEPRYRHAMAYDAARRVIVLFGGVSTRPGAIRDDTWEFDGIDWRKIRIGSPPTATASPAMVYDAERQQMVLVSANLNGQFDTWTYDGLRWTRASTSGPPVRNLPTIAYHAARHSVFLTGGHTVFGPQRDTWEWDGTSWTEHTGSSPTAGALMAYDAARDRLVAFGGRINPGSVSVWNGSWSELDTPNRPPSRFFGTMVYDAGREVVLVFGGDEDESPNDLVTFTDTWELGDDDWTQPAPSPYDRAGAGATFDEQRGRAIVVGGVPNDIFFDPLFEDTWELADGAWRRVSTTLPFGPEPARGSLVYDPVERITRLPPTLAYNGAYWTDVGLVGPISSELASAYDRRRNVVVYLEDSPSGLRTWELESGEWTHVMTDRTPPRGSDTLYDRERDRVMAMRQTVWIYDSSATPPTWTDTGVTMPENADAIAYSSTLGQTVAFGGGQSETWTYDGTAWTRRPTPAAPRYHFGASLIDDPINHRMLLIGGFEADSSTWQLKWVSASPDEVCDAPGDEDADGLADCADPDCMGAFCASDGMQCNAAASCSCPGGTTETRCDDGWDDDCDGLVDCEDTDCDAALCGAEVDCGDDADNDGDGLIDCRDPGCTDVNPCEAFERSCGDAEDNDGDGLVDCQDLDCYLAPCAAVLPP